MKSASDHLAKLLDERDNTIAELREQLFDAKERLETSKTAWSMPRRIDDKYPSLPLPRLEMEWIPDERLGWHHYVVDYRLVYQHLCDHLVAISLGRTTVDNGAGTSPFERGSLDFALPFRDGAHIHHDSAHLGLPTFAITPNGPQPLGEGNGYSADQGRQHRRRGAP